MLTLCLTFSKTYRCYKKLNKKVINIQFSSEESPNDKCYILILYSLKSHPLLIGKCHPGLKGSGLQDYLLLLLL